MKPYSSTRKGKLFENEVATLLELFGYDVDHDVTKFGSQIDLVATVDLPTHSDELFVECNQRGFTQTFKIPPGFVCF